METLGSTTIQRLQEPDYREKQQKMAKRIQVFKDTLVSKFQLTEIQMELVFRMFDIPTLFERNPSEIPKRVLSDIIRYIKEHIIHSYSPVNRSGTSETFDAEEERRAELLRKFSQPNTNTSKEIAHPHPSSVVFEVQPVKRDTTATPSQTSNVDEDTFHHHYEDYMSSFDEQTKLLSTVQTFKQTKEEKPATHPSLRSPTPPPKPSLQETVFVFQPRHCQEKNGMIILPITMKNTMSIQDATSLRILTLQLRGEVADQLPDQSFLYMTIYGEPWTVYTQTGLTLGTTIWKWNASTRECIPTYGNTIQWDSPRDLDRIEYQIKTEAGTVVDKQSQYLHILITSVRSSSSTSDSLGMSPLAV